MTLKEIVKISNDNIENVINAYCYGSKVYSTLSSKSDLDFIFIVDNKEKSEFKSELIDITYYTIEEFSILLENHEISAIECLYLNDCFKLKESFKFNFTLDLTKLRHSISAKSSNSYVKCKKKLLPTKDYNYFIAIKSLFHSFRIVNFGIQLGLYGKIQDYTDTNEILYEAYNCKDWSEIEKKFKTKHNNILTEFRKICKK